MTRSLYGPDVEARLATVLLAAETAVESKTLDTPDAALDVIYPLLAGREEEALVVIAVDRRVRFIESTVLTIGSSAHTVVDPAQILRWVLTRVQPAHGFVIAHNHPHGAVGDLWYRACCRWPWVEAAARRHDERLPDPR